MTNNKKAIRYPRLPRRARTIFYLTFLALIFFAVSVAVSREGKDGRDGDDKQDDETNSGYAIGLWGDLPYSPIQATVGVPNLIADMNSQKLAFTVHDGDLKQGSGSTAIPSPCD